MESGEWQFYRTISGTLAITNSNAIGITAAFCEEIQQVSPLVINFPWEIQTKRVPITTSYLYKFQKCQILSTNTKPLF